MLPLYLVKPWGRGGRRRGCLACAVFGFFGAHTIFGVTLPAQFLGLPYVRNYLRSLWLHEITSVVPEMYRNGKEGARGKPKWEERGEEEEGRDGKVLPWSSLLDFTNAHLYVCDIDMQARGNGARNPDLHQQQFVIV